MSLTSEYYSTDDLRALGISEVGKNVQVSKDSVITGIENIKIGNNVRIDSYAVILAKRGFLEIGSNVHIEPMASIVAHNGVKVGSFCTISHGVKIFTASADYGGDFFTNIFPDRELQKPYSGKVELQDHVIIGANSVIMPQLIIEEGAAIGALSFVRHSVNGWGIYGGNPLRFIRTRKRTIKSIGSKLSST
jgi:acetyltransferase-like isoleucine patch superfamily enzyme